MRTKQAGVSFLAFFFFTYLSVGCDRQHNFNIEVGKFFWGDADFNVVLAKTAEIKLIFISDAEWQQSGSSLEDFLGSDGLVIDDRDEVIALLRSTIDKTPASIFEKAPSLFVSGRILFVGTYIDGRKYYFQIIPFRSRNVEGVPRMRFSTGSWDYADRDSPGFYRYFRTRGLESVFEDNLVLPKAE